MWAMVDAGAGHGGEGPDVETSGRKKLWDWDSGRGNRNEVIKDRDESAV